MFWFGAEHAAFQPFCQSPRKWSAETKATGAPASFTEPVRCLLCPSLLAVSISSGNSWFSHPFPASPQPHLPPLTLASSFLLKHFCAKQSRFSLNPESHSLILAPLRTKYAGLHFCVNQRQPAGSMNSVLSYFQIWHTSFPAK